MPTIEKPLAHGILPSLLLTMLCMGCKKSPPATTPLDGGAVPASTASAGLTVTIGKEVTPLPYGRVTLDDDGLEATFSSVPVGCESGGPTDNRPSVVVNVPSGPDGKFYAGKPFGHAVRIEAPPSVGDAANHEVSAYASRLTLAEVGGKGTHVRGTISANDGTRWTPKHAPYSAMGAFDAIVCKDSRKSVPAAPAKSAQPPTGAVHGTIEGKPFAAASALMYVLHNAELNVDYVNSIEFYADAGATCDNRKKQAYDALVVADIGGARSDTPLLGTPQPATPKHDGNRLTPAGVESKSKGSSTTQAWVTFDKLVIGAHGSAAGTVVLASSPDTREPWQASGRFNVTDVCMLGL